MEKQQSNNQKQESSGTGSVVGIQQGRGFPKSKKKLLNKLSKPYKMEDILARSILSEDDQIDDVVRKRGSLWVLFDDETGTEISAFKKRKDAWGKQRGYRERHFAQKRIKQREEEARKKKLQLQQVVSKPDDKDKETTKKESLDLIKNMAKRLLKENYLTYMFEQQPVDDKSVEWDAFIKGISKEVLASDQKLKNILTNVAKAEFSTLKKALATVKDALGATGKFDVKREKLDKGEGGREVVYNFDVNLKEDNKTLSFGIKIVNGKPLIYIPDSTREQLNSSNTPSAKALRSELIHVNETVLNAMDDVLKSAHKRDDYLSGVESKLDKALGKMGTLQLAIVRKLVKNKFKIK